MVAVLWSDDDLYRHCRVHGHHLDYATDCHSCVPYDDPVTVMVVYDASNTALDYVNMNDDDVVTRNVHGALCHFHAANHESSNVKLTGVFPLRFL